MEIQINKETREELKNIYYDVKDLSNDDILKCPIHLIEKHYDNLYNIRLEFIDKKSAKIIQSDKRFQNTIKVLSDFVYFSGLRRELEICKKIISSPHPWQVLEDFDFYNAYVRTCDMEISGAMLKSGDKIVHLGSGPLPISIIIFSKLYDINCIGIEQEQLCYDYSLKVIEALGISDKIKIIHGNHFLFPIEDGFNHLIVGLDAKPKDEIFEHLAKNIKKGTSVSYRFIETNKLGKIRFTDMLNNHQERFKEYSYFELYKIIHSKPPVSNSIAFAKLI